MSEKKGGFGKLLAGVAIGAGLGVLFAPKKGSETRKELKLKLDEMISKVKNMDIEEVKTNVENKVYEIRLELEELDKEKILAIAKKKAKKIQDMAEELFEYTLEKGTPVLEKTATAIKEKTYEVTKEVLDKLDQGIEEAKAELASTAPTKPVKAPKTDTENKQ
jgi:gas vesicle protein